MALVNRKHRRASVRRAVGSFIRRTCCLKHLRLKNLADRILGQQPRRNPQVLPPSSSGLRFHSSMMKLDGSRSVGSASVLRRLPPISIRELMAKASSAIWLKKPVDLNCAEPTLATCRSV